MFEKRMSRSLIQRRSFSIASLLEWDVVRDCNKNKLRFVVDAIIDDENDKINSFNVVATTRVRDLFLSKLIQAMIWKMLYSTYVCFALRDIF